MSWSVRHYYVGASEVLDCIELQKSCLCRPVSTACWKTTRMEVSRHGLPRCARLSWFVQTNINCILDILGTVENINCLSIRSCGNLKVIQCIRNVDSLSVFHCSHFTSFQEIENVRCIKFDDCTAFDFAMFNHHVTGHTRFKSLDLGEFH